MGRSCVSDDDNDNAMIIVVSVRSEYDDDYEMIIVVSVKSEYDDD